MAAADLVTLVPPPPPSSWKVLLALALGHALRDSLDFIICLSFAGMWLGCAGSALALVGRRAWGESSLAVAMALDASARGADLALFIPSALLLRVWLMDVMGYRVERSHAAAGKSAAEIIGALLPVSANVGLLAQTFFAILEVTGDLVVSSARGSQAAERAGSVIKDVGMFGAMAMLCFVVIPALVRFAWRMKILAC